MRLTSKMVLILEWKIFEDIDTQTQQPVIAKQKVCLLIKSVHICNPSCVFEYFPLFRSVLPSAKVQMTFKNKN